MTTASGSSFSTGARSAFLSLGSRACCTRPAEQRLAVTISDEGLHWDGLDEDVSVTGLLAGRGDQTKRAQVAA